MSNLYVASEYKNKIINLLCMSDNFITLVNPQPSKCEDLDIIDVLVGGEWIIDGVKWQEQGHIFDYIFVNETTQEQKTFVLVETNIDSIQDNIFTDFILSLYIFTSKDLVRLTTTTTPTAKEVKQMGYFASNSHGNRIDALCDCIDGLLNGSSKLKGIGDVKPTDKGHMSIYIPNNNYYGKCLRYHITNYNSGGDVCE